MANGDGTPFPGAVLTLVSAKGQQVGQATASDDGSYQITAPATGSYLLICRAPSGGPQATWVSIDRRPTPPRCPATRHDHRITQLASRWLR